MRAYPTKILIAWSEAIAGNEKIAKWLFNNGYPELICVMDFLWGSTKAGDWMLKNRLPEWRAFSEYVGDENEHARIWLMKNKFDLLAYTGDAVHEKEGSFELLKKGGFTEFIVIAQKLNKLLYQIEFDTNIIYRSPIS
jgi:hypothetical protein